MGGGGGVGGTGGRRWPAVGGEEAELTGASVLLVVLRVQLVPRVVRVPRPQYPSRPVLGREGGWLVGLGELVGSWGS